MNVLLNLLMIEDDLADFLLIERHLRKSGLDAHCHRVADWGDLAPNLADMKWDAVLSDYNVPGMLFSEALTLIRSVLPDVPVILVSGTVGEERAVELLKLGVMDFVLKDNLTRLVPAIVRALSDAAQLRVRRAAEQALREKDQLLLEMSALAQVGGWEYELASGKCSWTEEVARIHEMDPPADTSMALLLSIFHQKWRRKIQAAFSLAIRHGNPFDLELKIVTARGKHKWVRMVCAPTGAAGPVLKLRGAIQDITASREATEQIVYQATHDALTNLPNRILALDRLEQAIGVAQRENTCVGIMFRDLDRFKNINDSLGHAAGDYMLEQVALRLRSVIRAVDTVGRQGGDEFIIIVPAARQRVHFVDLAKKILNAVSAPYFFNQQELTTTFSIGISMYPHDGSDAEILVKNADAAMYHAKKSGRDNFQFYSAEMNSMATQRLLLEVQLRHAVAREEFVVHYQPKVDAVHRKLIGAEALIRWNHPQSGLLAPANFIGIAEASGLIAPIGQWIMEKVCRQNQAWLQSGLACVPISVNLSGIQFRNKSLVDSLRRLLQETGLPPQLLELELTESVIMHDTAAVLDTLHKLKDLGLSLSIDDFGTGYSSLSYLTKFPIDTLKIDQAFVKNIAQDGNDVSIIKAIISMAHSLRMTAIAEGVESFEQCAFLESHQCDEMQGYYFSHPVPAPKFEEMLKVQRPLH